MTDFSLKVSDNITMMEQKLRMDKNFDILERKIVIGGKDAGMFFIDGFVDEGVVQRIMQFFYSLKSENVVSSKEFVKSGVPFTEVSSLTDINQVITAFLSGVSIIFIDGIDECITLDCRTYPMRNVSEPWKDRVLRGSRDGFVETLVSNIALIRRRIRDTNLSVEMFGVGSCSRTDVCISYIQGKADNKLVEKIKNKVQNIQVEALTMNVESLAECLLEGAWINPFPKFKYSERPDTAAASILDGNIVIMVDNSPAVMIIPTSVFDITEEADDYNFPPVTGTYLRLSRFIFTLVTVFLTPVWLLYMNNEGWIPQWLSFIKVTDGIQVPIFLQLILLEFAVDGLKLAAVNTPNMLSTPLSIVAGIVVGEYAVSSGWFNPEALLYMAVVSVGTYSQVSFEMGYALKFVRIITLILTQIWNLWGLLAGAVLFIVLVAFNKTISGKSYIYPIIPFCANKLKRKIFRVRLPHADKK